MAHVLPDLPYPKTALEPHISAATLTYHHDKHHAAYVKKLNELVKGTPLEDKSLEELIKTQSPGMVYNQAAQAWNHTFYWHCMKPDDSGGNHTPPSGSGIEKQLLKDFGSFDKFKEQFTAVAAGHFGSGWAWLSLGKDHKLIVEGGHDAFNPLSDGREPILTCDVWEHAYYVDYHNERPKYLQNWWNLVNWGFADKNLTKAMNGGAKNE